MVTNQTIGDQEYAPDAMPLRRDDLVLEELDGEANLYDPRYGAVHRFNAVTLFVWDLCDGSHTVRDIAKTLTKLFDVQPDEALESVERVIAELRTLDLVQGAPVEPMNKRHVPWWTKAPPEPAASSVLPPAGPTEELRLSRRQLLRGGVTKLVFVAPVISTFFAAGAYASSPDPSAFGAGGCKNLTFSCVVNTDCCDNDDCLACRTQFGGGIDVCCIRKNCAGCTTDAECCEEADLGCIAGTCTSS